jgi:hypothetical protein
MNLQLAIDIVDGVAPASKDEERHAWAWLRDTGATTMLHGQYRRRVREREKAGKA